MTAPRHVPVDAWSTFTWALRATWHELAPIIGVSLAWALAGVPLLIALTTGEAWLAVFAALPLCIATTALFGTVAGVAMGGAVSRPASDRFDPALGAVMWAWVTLTAGLIGVGSSGALAASAIGAIGVLVLPLALAYGAVRGGRGLAAVRAGGIIAILHPGLALTLASVLCLAAFACIASAGTMLLVAPAFVALMACRALVVLLSPGRA